MKNMGKTIVCMIALFVVVTAISINSSALINYDTYSYKFDFLNGD